MNDPMAKSAGKKNAKGVNLRKHQRVNFSSTVHVRVPDEDTAIDVFSGNISQGGVFLHRRRPLPMGQAVSLVINTRRGDIEVKQGAVVWSRPGGPGDSDDDSAGMGIRFGSLSPETSAQIGLFVDDLLTARKAPTEPRAVVRNAQGELMVDFSSPPQTKTRLLLHGSFVALVAVVTFFTLLAIKPIEEPKKEASKTPTAVAKQETLAKAPAAKKKAPTKAVAQPTAPAKPAIESEKKTEAAVSGPPVFSQQGKRWKMVLTVEGPVKTRHFKLKDPPRLAIDFLGASYRGSAQSFEAPAPFVSRVRVGLQPEHTRFVLDFAANKVPAYEVESAGDKVTVWFSL